MKAPSVFLYEDPSSRNLDLQNIKEYLANWLPALKVTIRYHFFTHYFRSLPEGRREEALDTVAHSFARIKVRNLAAPYHQFEPLYGEIQFERRRLANPERPLFGLLYDGFLLMNSLRSLLARQENSPDCLHIAFTNQLIGTYDENDRRYHARSVVLGFPCLISTSGVVEAPAKPREFYLLKQQYEAMKMADGVDIHLKEMFRGQYLDHDDPRMTSVMKGYVMQALFYQLTGEAFCPEKDCRLYNAHWQTELLAAQLGSRDLCQRHEDMIKSMVKGLE
ncbi:MAG: hypothetical protein HYY29_06405 [Chloroflexi bacterium]|nr:hypothetical protein [Chloroflexota bacterium]